MATCILLLILLLPTVPYIQYNTVQYDVQYNTVQYDVSSPAQIALCYGIKLIIIHDCTSSRYANTLAASCITGSLEMFFYVVIPGCRSKLYL